MPDVYASSESSTAPDLDIKSVLLVDDDPELAQTLKLLLESRNFIVTTASNGAEGLREVMDLDYEVILCDMVMPEMPGDMFYQAVKATKPHLCERFIFITGHGADPKITEFIEKVDGLVLFKPALIGDIMGMISLALRRGQRTRDDA